jgi:hypothetical protein
MNAQPVTQMDALPLHPQYYPSDSHPMWMCPPIKREMCEPVDQLDYGCGHPMTRVKQEPEPDLGYGSYHCEQVCPHQSLSTDPYVMSCTRVV